MSDQKNVAKPKQRMRYTDEELSLIKNTFAGQDELLEAFRRFFLQMPIRKSDGDILANISKNKQVVAIIRKAFLPTLDPKAPPHQLVDLWMTLELKDKKVDEAYPHIVARKIVIDYLEQQLSLLENKKVSTDIRLEDLSYDGKKEIPSILEVVKVYSNLVARNTLIGHTEMQLSQFTILAGLKDETIEETKAKLMQNSSQ